MRQLMKCPFCGGDADLYFRPTKYHHRYDGIVYVKCEVCDAQSRCFASNDPEQNGWENMATERAIDAWNRRAE